MVSSIIAMNHSLRYQEELDSTASAEAAELGKRAQALIRAGKASYDTFLGKTLADIRATVLALEATDRYWLGKRAEGDFLCYKADNPLKTWRGYAFTHAIGPFLSRLGASYYARYGHNNPAIQSPAEAEFWARTDADPLWVVIRASIEAELKLTPDEIAAYLRSEAEEYETDRPRLTESDVIEMHQVSLALAELAEQS